MVSSQPSVATWTLLSLLMKARREPPEGIGEIESILSAASSSFTTTVAPTSISLMRISGALHPVGVAGANVLATWPLEPMLLAVVPAAGIVPPAPEVVPARPLARPAIAAAFEPAVFAARPAALAPAVPVPALARELPPPVDVALVAAPPLPPPFDPEPPELHAPAAMLA